MEPATPSPLAVAIASDDDPCAAAGLQIPRHISGLQKKQLAELCRQILRHYTVGQTLLGGSLRFVLRILKRHPQRASKVGNGLRGIQVSTNGGQRCFQVVRLDGSIEDFSYHECLRDPRRSQWYFTMEACRFHLSLALVERQLTAAQCSRCQKRDVSMALLGVSDEQFTALCKRFVVHLDPLQKKFPKAIRTTLPAKRAAEESSSASQKAEEDGDGGSSRERYLQNTYRLRDEQVIQQWLAFCNVLLGEPSLSEHVVCNNCLFK